ncbi:MAG: hypothetical protein AABY27_02280, partial [Pseudomonadota bacterium]
MLRIVKYQYLPIAFIVLIFAIFIGDVGDTYSFYKNKLLLYTTGVQQHNSRFSAVDLNDYIKIKKYISKLTMPGTNSVEKKSAIINNMKIGDALGFLTENVESSNDLMKTFPNGVINTRYIIDQLKSHKTIAPYGKYNNNYLSQDSKLIYSDEIELSYVISTALTSIPLD